MTLRYRPIMFETRVRRWVRNTRRAIKQALCPHALFMRYPRLEWTWSGEACSCCHRVFWSHRHDADKPQS